MNDGRKNVPFSISEEDDSDVFSSIEVQRADEPALVSGGGEVPFTPSPSQPMQAVRASGAIRAPVTTPTAAPAAAPPRAPKPRLTIETSGRPGQSTAEISSDVFTIGRAGADLDLQDDYISTLHALIRMEDGASYLYDCGSKNGVFLRIADDLALEDWDEIAVGTQRFVFRTTWDEPREHRNPNRPATHAIGGDLPKDAARLVQMYTGGQTGGIWRVFNRVTIGRTNADVREPDDPWLSDPHATIERRSGKFFIKDASSQHGTFIRVLDSVELIDGDVFMVGRTRIKITYP